MKYSTSSDFSRLPMSTLTFSALDEVNLKELLLPFYLALDFDSRRARFGGGVSDAALRRHCEELDLDRAIVLGCWAPSRLLAAIELHPVRADWGLAELSVTECADSDRTTIVSHLLQLAAFAAGRRNCTTLVAPCCDREILPLLRGMGQVRVEADDVWADISDYASLLGRSNVSGKRSHSLSPTAPTSSPSTAPEMS